MSALLLVNITVWKTHEQKRTIVERKKFDKHGAPALLCDLK
jgi:hypothetical protein